MTKKVAIVGYGSQIRNDDMVGIVAVDKLKEIFSKEKENRNIGFFYGYNAVDMLGEFDDYDLFILIDAAMLKKQSGEFIKAEMKDIDFSDDTSITHSANFKNLLETAKMLGINTPKLIFYMIQPKNVEMGDKMSKEVQDGMEKMIETISEEIKKFLE